MAGTADGTSNMKKAIGSFFTKTIAGWKNFKKINVVFPC
jgi:hypothetical protein